MKIEVTSEQLRQYSIFLATPMYGGQCAGVYTKSIADLSAMCAKHGIDLRFYFLFNESLVQRARNYCVDEFLRSGCSHMLFIDSDIGFQAKDVLALLAVQIMHPETYKIVTAPYTKKTIAWEKVKMAVQQGRGENPFDLQHFTADFVFNPVKHIAEFRIDEPVEVSEAGTGFMLIPREVFEKYEQAYPQYKYKPDHVRTANFDGTREIMAYFDCGIDPESKRYLSEDYFFCWNARKIGIPIHMCPWIELQHVGTHIYRGSMAALAVLGASPTANAASNAKHYMNNKLTKDKKRNKIGTRP